MNGLKSAGYLVIVLGVVIALGLLGPFNPSCGTGIFAFFAQFFGACQSYSPYVGLAIIIAGIVIVGVSKGEEQTHRSLALALLAAGIVAFLSVSVVLSIGFFVAAGFTYWLGARVEGEE